MMSDDPINDSVLADFSMDFSHSNFTNPTDDSYQGHTVTDSYSKYPVSSNPKHGFQFSSPTYKWKNVIEISIFFILFNIV